MLINPRMFVYPAHLSNYSSKNYNDCSWYCRPAFSESYNWFEKGIRWSARYGEKIVEGDRPSEFIKEDC